MQSGKARLAPTIASRGATYPQPRKRAILLNRCPVFSIEMMLPLLLAAAGFDNQGQYSQTLAVPQQIRMELTPPLDGTIKKDEWDPFSPHNSLKWEPGRIY